jgi:hypothetical protein
MCCLYLQGTFMPWWWQQKVINTGTPTKLHHTTFQKTVIFKTHFV